MLSIAGADELARLSEWKKETFYWAGVWNSRGDLLEAWSAAAKKKELAI